MAALNLLWEQEVGGSNPLAPIYRISELGGSNWPAFSHVHRNVHMNPIPSHSAVLKLSMSEAGCPEGYWRI